MPNIKLIIGGIAIGVAVVITGLLATQTWNPSWNPFKPSLDSAVIEQGFENLSKVKTLQYEGKLSAEAQGGEQPGSVMVNLNGQIDVSQEEPKKGKSQTAISFSLIGGGLNIAAALEILGLEETLYLKITKMPEALSFLLNPELIESLTDKWIKVDQETIMELSGISEESAPEEIEQKSQILLEQLTALIKDKNLLVVEEKLADESVFGQVSAHYLVNVNKEAVKQIIPGYFDLIEEHFGALYGAQFQTPQFQQMLSDLPEKIDDAWEKLGGLQLELWLTKDEQILNKIKFSRQFQASEFSSNTASAPDGSISIDFELALRGFNEPVEISAPADFTNIEELLGPLMLNFLPSEGMNFLPETIE